MNAKQNPELYYLVNPVYSKKIHNKTEEKVPITHKVPKKKDKIFYKKRIQQVTKDCIQSKAPSSQIQTAYNEYLVACIEYFKEEDTMELIQEEYSDLVLETTTPDNVNIDELTEDLYIKKDDPKIEDFIAIKKSALTTNKPIEYPKQKVVDIKNSKFKTKGVKKKEKK